MVMRYQFLPCQGDSEDSRGSDASAARWLGRSGRPGPPEVGLGAEPRSRRRARRLSAGRCRDPVAGQACVGAQVNPGQSKTIACAI